MKKASTVVFTLVFLFSAAALHPFSARAAAMPDTGQTTCYNDTSVIECPNPLEAFYGQDAQYEGPPRSYTKLAQDGVELPEAATAADGWIMTRDNTTGLIWEIKQNKDNQTNYDDPRDADNTYTWYDPNPDTNGGNAGKPGNGNDTSDFIKALNDARFGGFGDWRMPTVKELATILDYSISPFINSNFFPNIALSYYWSSTTPPMINLTVTHTYSRGYLYTAKGHHLSFLIGGLSFA